MPLKEYYRRVSDFFKYGVGDTGHKTPESGDSGRAEKV
jgi:hypothetical protein